MKSLSRRTQIGTAILGSVILAASWVSLNAIFNSPPRYNGKTAKEWFYGPNRPQEQWKTFSEAATAFEAMGTNCIPHLIDLATTTDSPFNRLYCEIHPHFPSSLRRVLPPALRASQIQKLAIDHIRSFSRSELRPFTSSLAEIVSRIGDNEVREDFHRNVVKDLALGRSNGEANTNYFLTLLDDSNWKLRHDAAVTLSIVDKSITNGIPTLITIITNRALVDSLFAVPKDLSSSVADFYQENAYHALNRVSPDIAKQYEIRE